MLGLVVVTAAAESDPRLTGRWHYQDAVQEIVAEFNPDGTFHQITRTIMGFQEFQGRHRFENGVLHLEVPGNPAQDVQCEFTNSDTMRLTYASGLVLIARRFPSESRTPPPAKTDSKVEAKPPDAAPSRSLAGKPASARPGRLVMNRVEEPNEKAFTVLVPEGWQIGGGVFNVNPVERGGSGNSMLPKCDFRVQSDASGSVLIRWLPSWNYADLSRSPTGYTFFQPGQLYQGMLVRPWIGARQFLIELLRQEHPDAQDLRIIAEDTLPEVTAAFVKQAAALNQGLQQIGLEPVRFESMALLIEYTQAGQRYRETIRVTLEDQRASAFQWSNENTVLCRAPADAFDAWKPILDGIHASIQINPQWLAAVQRAGGERARMAFETQQYINKVANEIVENRRKTNAEIRHEEYLLLSGQEEYKNPFNGQVERDTSAYLYRWVNEKGSVILTDENSFDPNEHVEFKPHEWKRSKVWDRKP